MSEQDTETPAPEGSEEKRIDTLEQKVDRILSMLSGGGKDDAGSESEPEPAADPKAEMRAELAKLQAAERRKAARDAEKQANEDRLKKIEEKLTEKPPREYKRSTKFMRWEDKPE